MRRVIHMSAMALALVLVLAACGSSEPAPPSAASIAAAAAAEANESSLSLTDLLSTSEMLDSESGEIAALGDVITGDRAVLLWYWSPT